MTARRWLRAAGCHRARRADRHGERRGRLGAVARERAAPGRHTQLWLAHHAHQRIDRAGTHRHRHHSRPGERHDPLRAADRVERRHRTVALPTRQRHGHERVNAELLTVGLRIGVGLATSAASCSGGTPGTTLVAPVALASPSFAFANRPLAGAPSPASEVLCVTLTVPDVKDNSTSGDGVAYRPGTALLDCISGRRRHDHPPASGPSRAHSPTGGGGRCRGIGAGDRGGVRTIDAAWSTSVTPDLDLAVVTPVIPQPQNRACVTQPAGISLFKRAHFTWSTPTGGRGPHGIRHPRAERRGHAGDLRAEHGDERRHLGQLAAEPRQRGVAAHAAARRSDGDRTGDDQRRVRGLRVARQLYSSAHRHRPAECRHRV